MQTFAFGENSATEQLSLARSVMLSEAEAIKLAAGRIDGSLTKAAELILAHAGKVVVTGVGKSGLVGQKIVATLCSTGTPAVFLHPADALHGDLGVYEPGDPSILISKSGATTELVRLIPRLRQFESPLIGLLGNVKSAIGESMDVVLDGSVEREADPCNIAPTSSAVVAMALGDALASMLMRARNFTVDDFAKFHSGGQLGRNLLLSVRDVLNPLEKVACVRENASLKEVVIGMTEHPLGAACVIEEDHTLVGLITDGDLRRALTNHDDIRELHARDIMTRLPATIGAQDHLREALLLMENRPRQISVLPVIDAEKKCLGLIRIHDIYNHNLA